MEDIKLTQYSHGAGCGCKIAPSVLDKILHNTKPLQEFKNLLVGNDTKDDAAVMDIGNGQAIISTTDFFMPIVDDAFDFGRIASANAISDVYAMGGKPLMAVAILGWPVEKIPAELAAKVLEGSREICKQAGIPLAGGHSIDSPEPIFGLAVTGIMPISQLKKNSTAQEGDLLFLTKPIGTGIMGTALKRGLLKEEDYPNWVDTMCRLNTLGEKLGKMEGVNALTDVTGFGLVGHLIEMAEGSGLSAEISNSLVPLLNGIEKYTAQFCFPDNTTRNLNSYKDKVAGMDGLEFITLCDPQTSGGLLVSVAPNAVSKYIDLIKSEGYSDIYFKPIGKMVLKQEKVVTILQE